MRFSVALSIVAVWKVTSVLSTRTLIGVSESADFHIETPKCHQDYNDSKVSASCKTKSCARHVEDGLFSGSEIDLLHEIVNKGMNTRPARGGPTILDINTGYIRDTNGIENLFVKTKSIFTSEDFAHYGKVIEKLKGLVMKRFSISNLYFTAPTFITRLDGNSSWSPEGEHDEYWHPHVDGINTEHYHYSGLLYMSTYGADFTGGLLHFLDEDLGAYEQSVEPKAGRVVIFTSGRENFHKVDRVLTGSRYVLAFWFTCSPDRKFEIFLDGEAHTTFSMNLADHLKAESREKTKRRREMRKRLENKYGLEEL